MNKRILIFMLCITSSFFLVNQFFIKRDRAEEMDSFSGKPAGETGASALLQRSATADIPLIPLYGNIGEENPMAWGFAIDPSTCLIIPWEIDLPDRVFVQNQEGKFQPLSLAIGGDLALYTSRERRAISSVHLAGGEQVELLSSFQSRPKVTLGEYREGGIRCFEAPPRSDAIVLYQSGGSYLPIGLYKAESGKFFPLCELADYAAITTYPLNLTPSRDVEEEFYVLENASMQLVFSNFGGAIAEINLPYRSSSHPESAVLPIAFDRIISRDYPSMGRFPNHPYRIAENGKIEVNQPVQGGYYPLIRRSHTGGNLPSKSRFYAFNTIANDGEAETIYRMTAFDNRSIRFEAHEKNRHIIKTYSLPEEDAPYCLFATVEVRGNSQGLWIASGLPEVELISGNAAPSIKYRTVQHQKPKIEKFSLPKVSTTFRSIQPDWVSNANGYFTLIYDPIGETGGGFRVNHVPGSLLPSRITAIDSQNDRYPVDRYPGYEMQIPLRQGRPSTFRLYFGPIDRDILNRVDATFTDRITGYNPQYSEVQSLHGWFTSILEPFAKFPLIIMRFFYRITHSWGISIILLTVVLRFMMYPLNAWSITSTLKLQEINPKLQKLQEKYKKDPKRAQKEMMQFYRDNKVNPFGGCLPLIIQMPFLFGMLDLLKSTFSLRGVGFIPGWIDNLTAPDILFSWNYPLPLIGTEFHLLPVLLGVIMFFQQKLTLSQNRATENLTDQQKQQQKMGSIMTIVFTFLFYKFPSGLNIYWFSSMILQILQQGYMAKKRKKRIPTRDITIDLKKNKG